MRGGSNDSLSSNTDLGQAVQSACDELEALGGLVSLMTSFQIPAAVWRLHPFEAFLQLFWWLQSNDRLATQQLNLSECPVPNYAIVPQEQESLTKANELLRKLGYKGNITKSGK